jgi:hypothetical protein
MSFHGDRTHLRPLVGGEITIGLSRGREVVADAGRQVARVGGGLGGHPDDRPRYSGMITFPPGLPRNSIGSEWPTARRTSSIIWPQLISTSVMVSPAQR